MTLYPVQIGAETVRCRTGVPTLHLETLTGNVQITPGAFDHGHITVGVGVYNKGYHAINFGVENISATINGLPIAVVGSAELQKACQEPRDVVANRTGRSCRAAASQAYTTSRFSGVLRTPHGTYVWASYDRDNSIGGLGITAAIDDGTSGIICIWDRVDYTLDSLASEIVQTTIIDPDASDGGRVVIEKNEKPKLPYDVYQTFDGVITTQDGDGRRRVAIPFHTRVGIL